MREMTVAEYYQGMASIKFVGDSIIKFSHPKIILTDIEDYL